MFEKRRGLNMAKNEPVSSEAYNGMSIKIFQDESAGNPREEHSNLGCMVYWHRRHVVGDVDGSKEYGRPQDFIASLPKGTVVLPVFLLDHSGLALQTEPFGDVWDSGQVGYIYAGPDKIREEYSVRHITHKIVEKVKDVLKCEVSELGRWMNGEVYGYVVEDEKGNHVHSCWGYYDMDLCLQEARAAVDGTQEQNV